MSPIRNGEDVERTFLKRSARFGGAGRKFEKEKAGAIYSSPNGGVEKILRHQTQTETRPPTTGVSLPTISSKKRETRHDLFLLSHPEAVTGAKQTKRIDIPPFILEEGEKAAAMKPNILDQFFDWLNKILNKIF